MLQPKNFSVSYVQQGVGDYKVCQNTSQELPNQASYSTMVSSENFLSNSSSYLIDLPGMPLTMNIPLVHWKAIQTAFIYIWAGAEESVCQTGFVIQSVTDRIHVALSSMRHKVSA